MKLLLIRHAETVDNVSGVYAGITDSALTNHGVLQANRLGAHLAATDVQVSHIFSSDLQRAVKTAESIRLVQSSSAPTALEVTKLAVLREQDFGFYEGKAFYERPRGSTKPSKEAHADIHRNEPGFRDVESKEAMRGRMNTFINGHLLPLLAKADTDNAVVIVAHGIILNHLWSGILRRFEARNVVASPAVLSSREGLSLEYLGGWSNTGYVEMEIKPIKDNSSLPAKPAPPGGSLDTPTSSAAAPLSEVQNPTFETTFHHISAPVEPEVKGPELAGMSLVVKAVNSLEHLKGLKKTRGGIGSLKHDSTQKTVDSFFKKKKIG